MRITLLLIFGLFLQTSVFAQTKEQPREKGTEEIQQELQKQLEQFGTLFGGADLKIDSLLLQNFNLGDLNLGNLNLEELNIEDLMQLGEGEGTMPGGLDMQSMMELMQQSMQGMDLGNIEQLLGPLMGDLDKMMPQQPQQEEETLKGEDGKPIKKKKSTKKTYKL